MDDCYCKNCGAAYRFVNDGDAGDCWVCKKPLIATKRRPTRVSNGLAQGIRKSTISAKAKARKVRANR